MGIIWQIAWRNLREHRVKSLIIISLIAFGMLLLVLGNSIIDTGKEGIQKAFVKSFSGDILVGPKGEEGQDPNMFGAMQMGPQEPEPKTFTSYQDIYNYVSTLPGVEVANPQIYGTQMIDLGDNWRAYSGFFGVDFAAYDKMFPDNYEFVIGGALDPDEEGVLLHEKTWKSIKDDAKIELKVGDSVKLTGMGMAGKIKTLPLKGVIRFKSQNTALDDVGFMDLSSLRYLRGMVVGAASQVKIAKEDSQYLDASSDLDSLFGDNAVSEAPNAGNSKTLSDAELDNILGDTSMRAALNKADAGAWEYILIRVKEGADAGAILKQLNAHFAEAGWDIKAVDWEGAAGMVASFVKVIQLVFFILVALIAVVSIIVIMNTMVVSIIERTGEIGTMRALGAHKGYIRRIFLTETFTLSVAGGVIGLVVGGVILLILHFVGVPSNNPILDLVFGGKILYPVLSWMSAVWAMVIMVLVGVVSSFYPTAVALRITPVKAMSNN